MHRLILASLVLITGGCTMVYVESAGRDVAVENQNATVGNDGTAANSDRRDPTTNIAPLTTW